MGQTFLSAFIRPNYEADRNVCPTWNTLSFGGGKDSSQAWPGPTLLIRVPTIDH